MSPCRSAVGVLSAAVFVGIIVYLINVLSMVEHSERVIGNANEISKLSVDMETGMRGFLISGDESFLAPYLTAKPKIDAEIDVAVASWWPTTGMQVDRLRRVAAAQQQWEIYANEMIALRRANGDYVDAGAAAGAARCLTDDVRREFADFLEAEQTPAPAAQRRRAQRDHAGRSGSTWCSALCVAGLLAVFGRRELMRPVGHLHQRARAAERTQPK